MKKLMIAAAIVCAAAMSQAAIVKWNETNIYDEKGTTLVDASKYSLYLFTTDAVAKDSWNADTFASNLAKGYNMGLTGDGKAQTTTTAGISHTALTPLTLEEKTMYSFYTVCVNEAADAYYISTSSDQTISATPTDIVTLAFGSQKNYTQGKTDAWQSVPEPTSGLLLLLGVAGLALRRRRA